jgi:tetratricopeptide (TPR) repeat protein
MGAVYEAIDDQLGRPVAVKVLQSGLASQAMVKRFALEPRLLARLRHPGIAQIFEAGAARSDADGQPAPFFAMEYIFGAKPITDYAASHSLSIPDRLRLFIRVCDAVTHGHQRSVIHRDLKPANILVDHTGQPKVIDFGVARPTDAGAAATTLAGELLGTIRYMSPEQLAGADPDDVDVRADVYALGVVLYELLTGTPPHPDAPGGVLASIRDAQTRTPVPLSRLAPALAGDLETVALKAVDPDRDSRYQSVAEFAADLDRILRSEPISARPHSAVYQIRMFARRHRALVAGALAIVLALALGIVGTSIGLFRAYRAETRAVAQGRRAQRIADFLRNTVRSAQPDAVVGADGIAALNGEGDGWGSAGPADVGVVGVLRHAAAHLDTEFADDPAVHAEMALLFARTLSRLEDPDTALTLSRTALDLQTRTLPPDDPTLIGTRYLLGLIFVNKGRAQEADDLLRAAYEQARRLFGPLDPRSLEVFDQICRNSASLPGGYDRDVVQLRGCIAEIARARGPDSADVWRRHLVLIEVLRHRPALAETHADFVTECHNTIDGLSRAVGPDSGPVASACRCLAGELDGYPAELPEAEALVRRALAIDSATFGPDSGGAYEARTALVNILLRQGKPAEAEPIARATVDSSLRMIGPASLYTLKAKARLARILTWLERDLDEAERLAREAADGTSLLTSPTEDYASYHAAIWAAAVRLKHHPDRAEAALRERIALRGTRTPQRASAWVECNQYLQLALCLSDLNRPDDAIAAIRTASQWSDQLEDRTNPVIPAIAEARARLDPGRVK